MKNLCCGQKALILGGIVAAYFWYKKKRAGVGMIKSQEAIDFIWQHAPKDYRGIASDAWGEHEGKKTLMYMDRDGSTVLGLIEQMDEDIFLKYYHNAKKVQRFRNRG
jgi:hypothetical protein